jgi:hypothetical protein
MLYPDVLVPRSIAPNTEVGIYRVKDGQIADKLAEVEVSPSSTEVGYSVTIPGSQSQCYQYCDDVGGGGCNWCSPCGGTAKCGSHVITSHSVSATFICASINGACTNGTTHACWKVSWNAICG